jgi:broad specificity phosphatase PhoE
LTFKAAGQALKDMTFHQAYSSDLQRAHKTCQIILEENQKSSINATNIIQDKLLQERHMGDFEG